MRGGMLDLAGFHDACGSWIQESLELDAAGKKLYGGVACKMGWTAVEECFEDVAFESVEERREVNLCHFSDIDVLILEYQLFFPATAHVWKCQRCYQLPWNTALKIKELFLCTQTYHEDDQNN